MVEENEANEATQTHQRYAVSTALAALRRSNHEGRKLAKALDAMMKGKFRARSQYHGVLIALIPIQTDEVREPLLAAWVRAASMVWFKLEDTPRTEMVH
jgi:hypothetical protein